MQQAREIFVSLGADPLIADVNGYIGHRDARSNGEWKLQVKIHGEVLTSPSRLQIALPSQDSPA